MPRKKGFKHSEKTKKKIKIALSRFYILNSHTFSKNHRRAISHSLLGHKVSKKTKEKLSKQNRLRYKKYWWLKNQISKKLLGAKSHLWNGGKSFEKYKIEWNNLLKNSIRKRDNYQCQLCGKKKDIRKLQVHHIDYNKKNCKELNLITLCLSCHLKTNFDRIYWKKYFKGRTKT